MYKVKVFEKKLKTSIDIVLETILKQSKSF